MKAFVTAIIIFLWLSSAFSQPKTIDNKISKVELDTTTGRSHFACSNSSNVDTNLIENLSLWVYAKNGANEYLSIQNAIDYNDFSNGVHGNNEIHLRAVHRVSQPEIRDHRYLFSSSSYKTPAGIKNWPGSSNGEALASFVDVDQNNIYESIKGDYPFIRGDQCLLKLSHDNGARKTSLPGLNISMAHYYFIFPNAGNPVLDPTIGFRWVLKNNSSISYDSVKFGIHYHALLNSINSNYIGTDVLNNAMYVYESNSSKKEYTSIVLLNHTISNSIYYKNDGQPSNKNDIPTDQQHFINYLQSRWKDGNTLKLGSTGLDGDSSIKYVFPNTTAQGFSSWTEDMVGNQGGDRNGVLCTEIKNWTAGTYQVIEGALLFQNNIDSLAELYQRHIMLRNVYNNTKFIGLNRVNTPKAQFYPNPSKSGGCLSISSPKPMGQISFYSLSGSLLAQYKSNNTNHKIFLPYWSSQMVICHIQYEDQSIEIQKLMLMDK